MQGRKRLKESLLLLFLLHRHLDALDEVIGLLVRDQLLGVGASLLLLRVGVGRQLLVGVVEDAPDDLEPNLLRGASARLGRGLGGLFLGHLLRLWWRLLVVVTAALGLLVAFAFLFVVALTV